MWSVKCNLRTIGNSWPSSCGSYYLRCEFDVCHQIPFSFGNGQQYLGIICIYRHQQGASTKHENLFTLLPLILQFWSKEFVLSSNLCQKYSFSISWQLIKLCPQFPDELSPRFSVKIIRCLFYAYKKHTNGKSSCTVISIVLVSVSCQNVSVNIHRECSFSWWRPVVFVGS